MGVNAHKNWHLLRFLPFLVGSYVPDGEPAWFVLIDLKDITELVMASIHNDESLAFLEHKITEHRMRYKELCPDIKHYLQMIRQKFSDTPEVHLAQCVTYKGITYRKGMILAHGATNGILHGNVFYLVKKLCGWYHEHYRAFELSPAPIRTFTIVTLCELNHPVW